MSRGVIMFNLYLPIIIGVSSVAQAQDSPNSEVVEIEGVAVIDDSGFVETVRTDVSASGSGQLTTALAAATGVSIRQLGGPGSFAAVRIRGGDAAHVGLHIDGVPLSKLSSVVLDVNSFDLSSVGELSVNRSGGSGQEMAGVVNLNTFAKADHSSAQVTYGSLNHKNYQLSTQGTARSIRYRLAGSWLRNDGDFRFYDNRATVLNTSDDRTVFRENSDIKRESILGRLHVQKKEYSVSGGMRFVSKARGLPGPGQAQHERARLSGWGILSDLQLQSSKHESTLFLLKERETLENPLIEIGLSGTKSVTNTTSVGARHQARWGGYKRFGFGSISNVRRDKVGGSNRIEAEVLADTSMQTEFGNFAIQAGGSFLRTRNTTTKWNTPIVGAATYHSTFSPRITIKSKVGRYFRAPTLLEQFGDRGFIRGNSNLTPETGIAADLGVTLRSKVVSSEVAIYASRASNKIAFVSADGITTGAQNLDTVATWGVEGRGNLLPRTDLKVSGNLSWTKTKRSNTTPSFEGKEVPHTPTITANALLEWAPGTNLKEPLALIFASMNLRSSSYLDSGNFSKNPARTIASVGLRFFVVPDYSIGLTVENVLDQRTSTNRFGTSQSLNDFWNYPIPGRLYYLSVTYNQKEKP